MKEGDNVEVVGEHRKGVTGVVSEVLDSWMPYPIRVIYDDYPDGALVTGLFEEKELIVLKDEPEKAH